MPDFDLMQKLAVPSDRRIVLLVLDGLGDCPGRAMARPNWRRRTRPIWTDWPKQGVTGPSSPHRARHHPG